VLPKVRKRFATYGLSPEADFSVQDLHMKAGGVEFTVLHHGKSLGQLKLQLPGRYSATNALAAVAVAHELEIPFCRTAEALAAFSFARVASFIPITPGGLGTVDAALTALLTGYGATSSQALAADLMWRAATYLPQVLLGVLTFLWWRVTAARRRQRVTERGQNG